VFANGGFKVDPYFIERIEDANGEVVYQAAPKIACAACEQAPVSAATLDKNDGVAMVIVGGTDDAQPSGGLAAETGFDAADGFGNDDGFGAPAPFSPAVMAAAVNGVQSALHSSARPLLGMEDIPAA